MAVIGHELVAVAGLKVCSKCGVEKPATAEFFLVVKKRGALRSECRNCSKIYQTEYKKRDPEKWKDYSRRYVRDVVRPSETKDQQADRRAASRDWHHRNKERANANSRAYYQRTKIKGIPSYRWRNENREEYLATQARYRKKRRKNPGNKLRDNISSGIHHSLQGNKGGKKWQSLVNYSLEDLRSHLERQFVQKMSWDNYGRSWEVDHIVPLHLFSYETADDPEFKAAWALSNLRPLWWVRNRRKSGKRTHLL